MFSNTTVETIVKKHNAAIKARYSSFISCLLSFIDIDIKTTKECNDMFENACKSGNYYQATLILTMKDAGIYVCTTLTEKMCLEREDIALLLLSLNNQHYDGQNKKSYIFGNAKLVDKMCEMKRNTIFKALLYHTQYVSEFTNVFLTACRVGNIKALEILIEADKQSPYGTNALLDNVCRMGHKDYEEKVKHINIACENGHIDMMVFLFSKMTNSQLENYSFDMDGHQGGCALLVVAHGHLSLLEILLKRLSFTEEQYKTMLTVAIKENHPSIVKKLIKDKVNHLSKHCIELCQKYKRVTLSKWIRENSNMSDEDYSEALFMTN